MDERPLRADRDVEASILLEEFVKKPVRKQNRYAQVCARVNLRLKGLLARAARLVSSRAGAPRKR